MGFIKKLFKPLAPTFFRLRLIFWKLQKKKSFLILWNRGLGDIALGLYGLNLRIRENIQEAQITYITREDLKIGFEFLGNCNVIVDPMMKRGKPYLMHEDLKREHAIIIEKANPTDWLLDQLNHIQPKMTLGQINLHKVKTKIALHVQSETGQFYGYEKNWPTSSFRNLIQKLNLQGITPLLIGLKKDDSYKELLVEDLRGELKLDQTIRLILEECHTLVAPDSGILSLVYYFEHPSPLKIISLWADPHQGILKQKVSSPNPLLNHIPLIEKDLKNLDVDSVMRVL